MAVWAQDGCGLLNAAFELKRLAMPCHNPYRGSLSPGVTAGRSDAGGRHVCSALAVADDRAGGGDYAWTVKDTLREPQLKRDIEQLFDNAHGCVPRFSPALPDFARARTTTSGHGRIETHSLTGSALLTATSDWPGAAQVFKLERQTQLVARDQHQAEVVSGITSLVAAEADPARLLAIVRGHGDHANGMHYRRDTCTTVRCLCDLAYG